MKVYDDYDDFLDEYDEEEDTTNNSLLTFYQENKRLIIVVGLFILLVLLMLIFGGTSSKSNSIPDKKETIATISSTSENVSVNRSVKLEMDVNTDRNPVIAWSSSNPSVATVDSTGKVVGRSRGSATITAIYRDSNNKAYSQTCNVNVYEGSVDVPLSSISFKDGALVMSPNGEYQLKYSKKPSNAAVKTVSYVSGNTNVVTVDDNGLVHANEVGSTDITVTVNGNMTATITVYVVTKATTPNIYNLPTYLVTKANEYEVTVGKKVHIEYSKAPTSATTKFVEWSSSNESIATVDQNGYVKGVAAGDVTITIKSGNITTTTTVHVIAAKVPVTKVVATETNVNMNVGDTHQIVATVEPANATNKELRYKSMNTSIVTVDDNGVVTALKKGNARVRVYAFDSSTKYDVVYYNVGEGTSNNSNENNNNSGNNNGGSSYDDTDYSVATVKITSDNGAVNSSYSSVLNNQKSSYPTLTIKATGNYDTIKYCMYTYGSGNDCTPNTIYSSSFKVSREGVTVIKAQASYKGNDGEILTRYINIKTSNNENNQNNQANSCYCSNNGKCRYGVYSSTYNKDVGISKLECNRYINRDNKGCFLHNGRYVWGSYLNDTTNYVYVSGITESNMCLSRNK